ncbi:hypothetical protein [Paraburkholderia kururiensis]|uniref:hypothetical protein n=1 Tax=Paraburkholderia kururiensis TaxID=984307 RepID=UPI0012E0BA34|nr:hypothetical protein [Paraburkholderia kururiensis]
MAQARERERRSQNRRMGKMRRKPLKEKSARRSRPELKNAGEAAEKEKRGRTGRISVEIEEVAFGKAIQKSRPNIAKSQPILIPEMAIQC